MSVRDFVHLHTHSHYSLLEAVPKIPDLVAAAKADGQKAIALTDNGNMYGAIDFYKECKAEGIKPIIGVDFFVAPRTRHDKEHKTDDGEARLVLLARNKQGYQNLITMVSKSYLEGFHNRPRIDRELIEKYKDGLIAILPSHGGEVAYALRHKLRERAEETIEWYKKIYGKYCYSEITQHQEIAEHSDRMKNIIDFARKHSVPLVATHDIYYLKNDEGLAADLVNKIRTASVLNRENDEYRTTDFSFLSRERIAKDFVDFPEAVENSVKIAEICDLELNLGTWVFPAFPIPEGSTADEELRTMAEAGFKLRHMEETLENKKRVEYELSVIGSKGYSPYFLVVADLLRYAREKKIFTNTRGSAAGSLVSYLSGITNVNPIEYQLPFERFLNPERPSPPDIDMDLADNRRDVLIDYVRQKYGDDHVAQIGTFGTMMARAAVRDVSRALGYSYSIGDAIAKLIPFGKQGFPVTIKSALDEVPELATAYKNDAAVREILDLAQKIEGNARHVGVHAAGVVIAPTPVTDFAPVQFDPKGGKMITQYDMYAVEDAGLLKFDFLGLTNLSVLADAVERVEKRLGIIVDTDRLPLDSKTFEMLARGETLGVFQMAGSGMTNYLVQLKPTRIDDLNVMVALYRPGPMDNIDEYIARKNGTERITYMHPKMESYLAKTYGVLVYQDDLLMTAIELAGYSWGEVDKFRKAVGKKIPEEMAKQHVKFVEGCQKHSKMSERNAEAIWKLFEPFQGYGFNKAHAASYGNLAYQTAYMKANFAVDYMAAVLTADAGDVEKISEVVAECRRMKIDVLPPSVNESYGTFTVASEKSIRFGLYSIKNFGEGVGDSIIAARAAGPFKNITDFLTRVADKALNKKSLEALIQCGAMDEFGERGSLMVNVETLLTYHREHLKAPSDQGSLFMSATSGPAKIKLDPAPEASMDQKLLWEKELLGLYISGHPLDKHKSKLSNQKTTIKHAKEHLKGVETVIAGYIETVNFILTKKGEKMVFLQFSDFSGTIEVVAFPRTLKEHEKLIIPGTCVMFKGRVSDRNGNPSFVVEKAKAL